MHEESLIPNPLGIPADSNQLGNPLALAVSIYRDIKAAATGQRSLDQQQAALLVAVERVHGRKQTRSLD